MCITRSMMRPGVGAAKPPPQGLGDFFVPPFTGRQLPFQDFHARMLRRHPPSAPHVPVRQTGGMSPRSRGQVTVRYVGQSGLGGLSQALPNEAQRNRHIVLCRFLKCKWTGASVCVQGAAPPLQRTSAACLSAPLRRRGCASSPS